MKKKKQTKADKLRSWGLPYPSFQWSSLRYKQPYEKGVYWYWFSLFVRQRDVADYGTCISCNRPIAVDTCDAGHFIAADGCGRDLLFDPLNVNAECSRCNAWDANHLIGYERGLKERYGEGAVQYLKDGYWEYRKRKTPLKDFKASEYGDKIKLLTSYQQVVMQDVPHL